MLTTASASSTSSSEETEGGKCDHTSAFITSVSMRKSRSAFRASAASRRTLSSPLIAARSGILQGPGRVDDTAMMSRKKSNPLVAFGVGATCAGAPKAKVIISTPPRDVVFSAQSPSLLRGGSESLPVAVATDSLFVLSIRHLGSPKALIYKSLIQIIINAGESRVGRQPSVMGLADERAPRDVVRR